MTGRRYTLVWPDWYDVYVYRTAKMVRINYSKKDYFSVTWDAGGDVEIKSEFNGTIQKELERIWNIVGRENRNVDTYVKVTIDKRLWIIEQWRIDKDEVFIKYGRSMKDFLDVKVDYGKPHQ
jgi:hypothetical protein